jgi:arginine/ornithine transport system substrate-binding protein
LNVPLPERVQIFGFGIGIKKENHELTKKIQQAVHALRESGKLKELEEKWFKGDW